MSYGGGGGYPQRPAGYDDRPYNSGNQQRPQPPPPWVAEWDSQANSWVYINRQNGQRTHQFPQQGGSGGYNQQGRYPQQGGGYPQQGGYSSPPPQQAAQKSHGTRNAALAGLAGLAGGALLMHEGHKAEEHWDEDKARFRYDEDRARDDYDYNRDRIEDRVDYDRDRFDDRVAYDQARFDDRVAYDEDRVEDFPDDAARWAGRRVQQVEDIPDDVAGWAGRKVQEVEDIPDDVAGWAGRRVQGVEDFADGIDDSFDAGRAQQEYRDDRRYDDDW